MAAKSSRGLPVELAAKHVVKEAVKTRGLKDDTTCIVVDIITPDNGLPSPSLPKKQNRLRALLFGKRSRDSAGKLSKKLSAINIVEELFEEGSAMLAEWLTLLQVTAFQSMQVPFSPLARSHGNVLFYVLIVAVRRMLRKENALAELKCHR